MDMVQMDLGNRILNKNIHCKTLWDLLNLTVKNKSIYGLEAGSQTPEHKINYALINLGFHKRLQKTAFVSQIK